MLEQRTAPREPFISEILYAMKGKAHQDISRDISINGIFIETAANLKAGDTLTICFEMTRGSPIKVEGEIVRIGQGGVGVRFIQPLSDFH